MRDDYWDPEPTWSESFHRLWPQVELLSEAKRAASHGVLVYGFLAGLTFVETVAEQIDPFAGAGVTVLLAAIAIGTHRMSRVAAVAGAVYLLTVFAPTQFTIVLPLVTALMVLGAVNALRATFAFHARRAR